MAVDRVERIGYDDWTMHRDVSMRLEGTLNINFRINKYKKEECFKDGSLVAVVYTRNNQVVGEAYGISVPRAIWMGFEGLEKYSGKKDDQSIYLMSNIVFPDLKTEGIMHFLIRAFRGYARLDGFRRLVGHGPVGIPIRETWGADIISEHKRWGGTQDTYLLFAMDIRSQNFLMPYRAPSLGPVSVRDIAKSLDGTEFNPATNNPRIEDIIKIIEAGNHPVIALSSGSGSLYYPVDCVHKGKLSLVDEVRGGLQ